MRIPQIKDILPITNGLFQHMNYTFRAEVSKQQLDYLLVATVGRRNPAPVVELLREEGDNEFDFLDDAQLTSLAALMLSYYKPKWDKLARIYDIEYDPIHNYLELMRKTRILEHLIVIELILLALQLLIVALEQIT